MKVKKALTLLPALLLVVGLGACDGSSTGTTSGAGADGNPTTAPEGTVYTLRITLTNYGQTVTIPDYAVLYYAGETNNWGFDPVIDNGNGTYDVCFTEMPAAGIYEYGLLLDYSGSTEHLTNWTYKVNEGSGNETFTVSGTEEEGYINEVNVETVGDLGLIIPDPSLSPAVNVTFRFHVTSVDTYGCDVYIVGSFNGDNWSQWLQCTYNDTEGSWDYLFASLDQGTVEFKVCMVLAGHVPDGLWDDDTEITADNQTVIITDASSNSVLEYYI